MKLSFSLSFYHWHDGLPQQANPAHESFQASHVFSPRFKNSKQTQAQAMNPLDYGQPNPKAPKELSQFGFLIGAWKCDIKVKGEDGTYETHKGSWAARYILDGYVIADEFRQTGPNGELIRLGTTYRSYNSDQKRWVMKWLDAMNSTWLDLGPEDLGRVHPLTNYLTKRSGVRA